MFENANCCISFYLPLHGLDDINTTHFQALYASHQCFESLTLLSSLFCLVIQGFNELNDESYLAYLFWQGFANFISTPILEVGAYRRKLYLWMLQDQAQDLQHWIFSHTFHFALERSVSHFRLIHQLQWQIKSLHFSSYSKLLFALRSQMVEVYHRFHRISNIIE